MNPFSLFRKFIKMVRGGAASWQIIVSCMLGVIIGMIPGFNGLSFALLVVFALINLSLPLMLIGVVIGKALCLALAPYTFEAGYFIIHNMGIEGMFAQATRTPFVALMGLDIYCLVGGLPVAIIIGFIIGGIIARSIKMLRIGSMAAAAKSVKVQKITSNTFTRIIMRILFGKQKKSLAEMLSFKHPILRKSGIILLAIIVALVVGFEMFFINDLTHSAMIGGLEKGVGAEVNLKSVNVSLIRGRFELDGLQVTDAAKPTHNVVNVNKLYAKLNMMSLLTKRIVVDELVIGELLNGAPRDQAGRVDREPEREEKPSSDGSLSDYFEHKDQILEYLAKLKDYLESQEQQRKEQEARDTRTPEEKRKEIDDIAATQGYLNASASSLLTPRPMITIRKITIEKLPVPNLGDCVVTITELSDDLPLNEEPMGLDITSSYSKDFSIKGAINFVKEGALHELKANIPKLPVAALGITDKCPLDIKDALANLKFDGKFNRDSLNFPIKVIMSQIKVAEGGNKKILGLDPAMAKQMFESAKEIVLAADVSGALQNPDVKVNIGDTLASLKNGLILAGKTQLANMASSHLKDLGVPVDPELLKDPLKALKDPTKLVDPTKVLKDPTKIIKDPTNILKDPTKIIPGGGLLPGKKDTGDDKTPSKNPLDALKGVIPGKDDAKDPEATTKPKDPAGGLLDGLRL